MVSETAKLLASLELQDKFSGPAKAAEGALGGLDRGSGIVQRGFGLLGKAGSAVGGAFDHLKGRIGDLLTGPLGMLGLAGGIGGLVALVTGGISDVKEFGGEVSKLSKVTGLDTEQTSRLAGVFHRFGIEADTVLSIAGAVEKNLFKLGGTAKAAAKFQDKYGLALVDSKGQLKDFNTLLLDSAEFFNNKQIPAAQKAAALAAIYGKSWQTFLPVFSAGAKGISEIEEEAAKLGLTLTKDNLVAIGKLKKATGDWGQALGGLKLQLGLAVVPLLTDLTKGATAFLTTTDKFGKSGMQKVVGFFKGLIQFGKQAFGVIQTQVVPVVQKVIKAWNDLPAPLKSILVKGAAGNFAIKFLLGFSPVDVALSVAGAVGGKIAGLAAGAVAGAFGSFIGDFFGRTAAQKLIPQMVVPAGPALPVFVVNPGFGVGGPGGGIPPIVPAAGGAAAGISLGTIVGLAAGILGLTTVAGSDMGQREQAQYLTQQLREGLSVRDALNKTGATLAAVEELVSHSENLEGLSKETIAELKALANQPGMKGVPTPAVPIPGQGRGHHGFVERERLRQAQADKAEEERLLREARTVRAGNPKTVLPNTALAAIEATPIAINKLPPIIDKQAQRLQALNHRMGEVRAGIMDTNTKLGVIANKPPANLTVQIANTVKLSISDTLDKVTSAFIASGKVKAIGF